MRGWVKCKGKGLIRCEGRAVGKGVCEDGKCSEKQGSPYEFVFAVKLLTDFLFLLSIPCIPFGLLFICFCSFCCYLTFKNQ